MLNPRLFQLMEPVGSGGNVIAMWSCTLYKKLDSTARNHFCRSEGACTSIQRKIGTGPGWHHHFIRDSIL